jgi:hypothetical protein
MRRRVRASLELSRRRRYAMLDILMLALGAALFALAIGYGYACERL